MTIVVEDGTGKADAESYASVTEADDFIAKWHNDSTWSGLATDAKERSLRRATRFVDSHRFVGYRTYNDQALDWPRASIGTVDNQVVQPDEVPRRIREAAIEAALRDANGDDLLTDHDGGSIRSESRTVGPIQRSTTYADTKQPGKTFEAIRALLKPFMRARGLHRAIR